MRKLIMVLAVIAGIFISGCATSHYSTGRDFDSSKIAQIVKGKTTDKELETLMGNPFSKNIVSASSESWHYLFTDVTAKAKSYVFSTTVDTNGIQKKLDVLIESGVVTNYTYTESPLGNQAVTTMQ